MGKEHVQNTDYFKTAGGSLGRRSYAREKRKFAKGHEKAIAEPPVPPHATPVAASGAGTETLRRGQQKRAARLAKQVEQDEVRRTLEVSAGAPAPAERQLPPATRRTELADLGREVMSDAQRAVQAARTLVDSITALVRTPVRLYRVLRVGA